MEQKIFRKKSIDKINSPENLNDYIRVTNPGVWLILAAVIALLIGACVWGFFGHIDTTADASAVLKIIKPVALFRKIIYLLSKKAQLFMSAAKRAG